MPVREPEENHVMAIQYLDLGGLEYSLSQW